MEMMSAKSPISLEGPTFFMDHHAPFFSLHRRLASVWTPWLNTDASVWSVNHEGHSETRCTCSVCSEAFDFISQQIHIFVDTTQRMYIYIYTYTSKSGSNTSFNAVYIVVLFTSPPAFFNRTTKLFSVAYLKTHYKQQRCEEIWMKLQHTAADAGMWLVYRYFRNGQNTVVIGKMVALLGWYPLWSTPYTPGYIYMYVLGIPPFNKGSLGGLNS